MGWNPTKKRREGNGVFLMALTSGLIDSLFISPAEALPLHAPEKL